MSVWTRGSMLLGFMTMKMLSHTINSHAFERQYSLGTCIWSWSISDIKTLLIEGSYTRKYTVVTSLSHSETYVKPLYEWHQDPENPCNETAPKHISDLMATAEA